MTPDVRAALDKVHEMVRRAIEEPDFVMTRQRLAFALEEVTKASGKEGQIEAFNEAIDAIDIIEL